MRNKRSSNFSNDRFVRFTVKTFPALLERRSDGVLLEGGPKTFRANAESFGKIVVCDFQNSRRVKSVLLGGL